MTVTVWPAIPQKIGPYEILGALGEGGMGTVYKGRSPLSGQSVAIKVLAPEVADNPVAVERFRQEYRASSSLVHPNLVRGLDFGQDDSQFYLVMEFVGGEDLATRIQREGRLAEDEAVRIIVQVARALQLAHEHQIIHRDVKPSNILLTPTGQAKLTDLGLVKDHRSDLDLTRPLAGLGTPHFMAPEQFGDAKHADARCDIYSLGATLYMALTGELPFHARSNLHLLKKKLKNDLTPPRKLVPKLSEMVDLSVRRALRADANQRQASCLEFIASLTGAAPVQPASEDRGSRIEDRGSRIEEGAFRSSILDPRSSNTVAAERRVAVRYPSAQDVSCLPLVRSREQSWSAQVHDISSSGICLRMSRRFEPGALLLVELARPGQNTTTSALARVRWVRQQSKKVWFLGCAFEHALLDFEMSSWM